MIRPEMLSDTSRKADKRKGYDRRAEPVHFRKVFIKPVAEHLFNGIKNSQLPELFPSLKLKEFNALTDTEKLFWYNYAGRIGEKFGSLTFILRKYEDFCRTCIITDEEIHILAQTDYEEFRRNKILRLKESEMNPFFLELNYLVPVALKKAGYEIIRTEELLEIQISMVRKLARAIHSRYMQELRNQGVVSNKYIFYNPVDQRSLYAIDFEDLPDEIKYSNIDSATHIPTKLLAIGYKIRQVKKGYKPFALHLNEKEIETMAKVEHIRWSWEKRLSGWIHGSIKDEIKKTHPSLIPYENLQESEKEKDRELVKLIPAFLQDIEYEAYPVSPNRIKKLSYAIKPQSVIHKILAESRELNEQIKDLAIMNPSIEETVTIRNKKIEEAIREVESSYNYAQHIQETFLPDDLYVRECFPDSFILFKPKDIVSGDFYFFSKLDHLITFAAIDCTGHGIPGALLSTLGYGILDQAVNEIKLTEPSHILHHLYSKIHRYLRSEDDSGGMSDDMDIILCILDTNTNILNYSGVKNPLYRISGGKLIEYKAQQLTVESCDEGECMFVSSKIKLNISDTIYLCSDGYSDQFGGKRHKRYLTSRLKNFLQNLNDCSLPEQSDRLYEEIEKWREENNEDQTDDILVIGIRI